MGKSQCLNKSGKIVRKQNNEEFLENVRIWQMKKEKNIKQQKELKEEKEIKGLRFAPTLNQRSLNIMKKLQEIQNKSVINTEKSKGNKKSLINYTFKPALTEKTKKITINRKNSVFDRLYKTTVLKIERKKTKVRMNRKGNNEESSSVERNYSINSGRDTISNRSFIEEVKFDKSMSFIINNFL